MNCKPDDMVFIVRTRCENVEAPAELLGTFATVTTSFEDADGVTAWNLTQPVVFVAKQSYMGRRADGGGLVCIAPGERCSVFTLPDACLQPIRGVPAVDTVEVREPCLA